MFIEVHDENGRDKYLINIRHISKVEEERGDTYIKLGDTDILVVKEDFDTVKHMIMSEEIRDKAHVLPKGV